MPDDANILINVDDNHDKYYLFPYYSSNSGKVDKNTHLIWAFKDNNEVAVNKLKQDLTHAIEYAAIDFLDVTDHWYSIAIPRSSASGPNVPCEIVSASLAASFSWIEHLPSALVRMHDVPSSKLAKREKRSRTWEQEHTRTIAYHGPTLSSPCNILLIDDILTTSSTFNACCGILRKSMVCEHIFGLFIGWTPPPMV